MGLAVAFRNFAEAAWLRTCVAGGTRFTVRAFPWILAGHEIHHRKVLIERYGLNKNTLDSRLHTYRKELRKLLAERGIDC